MKNRVRPRADNTVRVQDWTPERSFKHLGQPAPNLTAENSLFELRCIEQLSRAKNEKQLLDGVMKYVRGLGFSDFSYIRLKNYLDIGIYFITASAEVKKFYEGEEIWPHDQMLQYAARNTRAIFQSTIDSLIESAPFSTETIEKNRRLQSLVKSLGYRDYFNIPMLAENGDGNVMLSLTCHGKDAHVVRALAAKEISAAHSLCRAIDHVTTMNFSDLYSIQDTGRFFSDSAPMRLIRTMLVLDLTVTQAADYLQITRDTANKQLATFRNYFGVSSTSMAIYQAIKVGLIKVNRTHG